VQSPRRDRTKLESVLVSRRSTYQKAIYQLTLEVQVKPKVLGQVHSNVRLRRDREISVLDFLLVHIDRHISPLEMLESAGVIKVKVAHDDGFHIFDVMAGLLDLRLELVVFGVIDAGEDVVQWGAPDFRVIFSSAGLEEDQAFGRVLNQDGDDDQFPAGATCVGVACCGSAAATDEPSFLGDGLGCELLECE
jgi:hypothetical protein